MFDKLHFRYTLCRPEKIPSAVPLDANQNVPVDRSHVYIGKEVNKQLPTLLKSNISWIIFFSHKSFQKYFCRLLKKFHFWKRKFYEKELLVVRLWTCHQRRLKNFVVLHLRVLKANISLVPSYYTFLLIYIHMYLYIYFFQAFIPLYWGVCHFLSDMF